MNLNDEIKVPDLQALIRFGKLGFQLLAMRLLTTMSLLGTLALSGYVAYNPTWQGAACVGIVALLVFQPSLRAETKRDEAPTGG